MTGDAAATDAGVQYRIRGQGRVICRRCRVANAASLIAGIGHVARRQRSAIPVGRGVANAAVVRCHHLAGGVIGWAALQRRIRCAHIETESLLMASNAVAGDESVPRLSHVRRAEGAGGIGAGGMAGTTVGTGQVRNVRRREHGILRRVGVVPGQCGRAAMALSTVATNTGVQYRIRR